MCLLKLKKSLRAVGEGHRSQGRGTRTVSVHLLKACPSGSDRERDGEQRETGGNGGKPSERLCRWRETNREAGRGSEVEKTEMQRPKTEMCGEGWGQIGNSQSPRVRECNIWGVQGTLASIPQTSLEDLLVPQCRTLPKNGGEAGQELGTGGGTGSGSQVVRGTDRAAQGSRLETSSEDRRWREE